MTDEPFQPPSEKAPETPPKKSTKGTHRRRRLARSKAGKKWSQLYSDPEAIARRVPPGFLTGERVVALTGITRSQFQSICRRGKLRSSCETSMGERLYAEESVALAVKEYGRSLPSERLMLKKPRPEYTTEQARRVLEAHRAGRNLGDVFLDTLIPMKTIEVIVADFARISGSIVIWPETMKRIGELGLPGTFPLPDADELVDVLSTLADAANCEHCRGAAKATLCRGCAKRRFEKVPVPATGPAEANGSAPRATTNGSAPRTP